MKIKMSVVSCLLSVGVMLGSSGCMTGPDGKRKVDVARVAQARDAITPVASGAIRRALLNSPEHAPKIAEYVASIGNVFCTMSLSNEFRPEFLIAELERKFDPELAKIGDGFALDIKNSVIALYKILWRDAGRAEIPPDQWLHQLTQLFCESIAQGLTDAGFPGGVRRSAESGVRSAERGQPQMAQILSRAQCSSGGRFQSRPYPARTAKIMESASQLCESAAPDGREQSGQGIASGIFISSATTANLWPDYRRRQPAL